MLRADGKEVAPYSPGVSISLASGRGHVASWRRTLARRPPMSDAYPLTEADPAKLGFASKPLQYLDALIRQHIEEGRYPGAQIALARHGQVGAVPHLWRRETEPSGSRRPANAVPAVQSDQGADHLGRVDADRGRQALVHGPGRRLPARVCRAWQGRHHVGSGDVAPGRLSVAATSPGRPGPITKECAPKSATSRSTGRPGRGCNTTRAPRI